MTSRNDFDFLLNSPDPVRPEEEHAAASMIRLPSIQFNPRENTYGYTDDATAPILSDVFISPLPWESVWRIPRSRELDNLPAQSNSNSEQVTQVGGARTSGKKVSTLSEVLNTEPSVGLEQTRSTSNIKRKRSRGADEARKLPRPSSPRRQGTQRQQPQPLLPPLLAPLYEPPPNARLVPSINTDTYGDEFGAPSFPHPRLGSPTADDWHVISAVQEENLQPPFTSSAELDIVVEPVQATDEPPQAAEDPAQGSPANVENDPQSTRTTRPPKTGKGKRPHRRWTEAETKDLLQGVTRYGIGSWKKILAQPDFHFQNRTAVDLKDRFRTCYPEQYLKRPKVSKKASFTDSGGISTSTETSSSAHHPQPTSNDNPVAPPPPSSTVIRDQDRAPAIIYPKRLRRDRQVFTSTEDDALLKGFRKHKARWNKIRLDPELQLSHRSRTDLRDRFRNKFTALFVEAGYVTSKVVKGDGGNGERGGEEGGDGDEDEENDTRRDQNNSGVTKHHQIEAENAGASSPSSSPSATAPATSLSTTNPPNPKVQSTPKSKPKPKSKSTTSSTTHPPPCSDQPTTIVTSSTTITTTTATDWTPDIISHLSQMDISSLLVGDIPTALETQTGGSAGPLAIPPTTVIRMSDILNDVEDYR